MATGVEPAFCILVWNRWIGRLCPFKLTPSYRTHPHSQEHNVGMVQGTCEIRMADPLDQLAAGSRLGNRMQAVLLAAVDVALTA